MKENLKLILVLTFACILSSNTFCKAENFPASTQDVIDYASNLALSIVDTNFRDSWVIAPEHLNKIEAGKHYGWPHCWADPSNLNAQVEDPNFRAEPNFCSTTQPPAITFTSHTTPIGITFLDKTNWPAEYK